MDAIADILLGFGALGAALYCIALGRRLRRFTDLETGIGGAVAVLSAQVDDLAQALSQAQQRASAQAEGLLAASDRAGEAARRLELLLAALHDLPEAPAPQPGTAATPRVFIRQAASTERPQ